MRERGYYREWRGFDESRAWQDEDPRVWKLWCLIKGSATHKASRFRGESLEPGDVFTSWSGLAGGCAAEAVQSSLPRDRRFTPKIVRRIVRDLLIPWGYVKVRPSRNGQATILHIVQWARWQNTDEKGKGAGRVREEVGKGAGNVQELITPNLELRTAAADRKGGAAETPVAEPEKKVARYGGLGLRGMAERLCKELDDPEGKAYYEITAKNEPDGMVESALAETLDLARRGKLKKTKAQFFRYELACRQGRITRPGGNDGGFRAISQLVETVAPRPADYVDEDPMMQQIAAHRAEMERRRGKKRNGRAGEEPKHAEQINPIKQGE